MSAITIEAPAKINAHLQVGDRRLDGFHDLESLFLALAFGDTLHFETTPSEAGLEIAMNGPAALPLAIPPAENIISRAVSLFRERTGFNQGLKVTVEKRIPPGGGLGGGSSDAAAALLAINRLAADGGLLDSAELLEMGASLGSDVPFFMYKTPAAWVSGRGERIQPIELPEAMRKLAFVLVNPGFPSDTAEAYRLLDSWREGRREEGGGVPPGGWLSSLFPTSLFLAPHFFNDFLPVLSDSDKGPVYQRMIDELRKLGADFAGLSGSGSTCFGVFSGQEQAEAAREVLSKSWPFVIFSFLLVC